MKRVELKADIPGLIAIFGDSLYSDFGSVVRELIQNAHDATILSGDTHEKKVGFAWKHYDSTLNITDNGIGMSVSDIEESLNNFGRSNKKSILDRLQTRTGFLKYEELIGEYGVGFLSAMSVSEYVTVLSYRESEFTKWHYVSGNSTADIETLSEEQFRTEINKIEPLYENQKITTVVSCKFKQEIIDKYNVNERTILDSLKKYVALLPIPIFYNEERINFSKLVWEKDVFATEEEWEAIISELHGEEPNYLIPLDDAPKELKLTGTLYIKKRSWLWGKPRIDTYIKGMYVCSESDIIVPDWAKFIAGIINSNALSRIVSGENVKDDKTAKKLKEYLENKILKTVEDLSRTSPTRYRKILGPHDNALKECVSAKPEILRNVWDKIPIPATGGRNITLNRYLEEVNAKLRSQIIFYINDANEYTQAGIVSNATEIPVLRLDQTRDNTFVSKAAIDQKIEMRSANSLAQDHFQRPSNPDSFNNLIEDCLSLNISAEARVFTPSYVPALLVSDKKTDRDKELVLELIRQAEIDTKLQKKVKHALTSEVNPNMAFYLNTSNILIKNLAQSNDISTRQAVLLALYNIAFMNVYKDLQPGNLKTIYDSIQKVMLIFLQHSSSAKISFEAIQNILGDAIAYVTKGELFSEQYAILFHDIIGSTWMLSNIGNDRIAGLYTQFCNDLNRLAISYGGYIDKFTGDGILTFFGNIKEKEVPVRRAVEFGRETCNLARRIFGTSDVRADLEKANVNFSGSRVSISYGECNLGFFANNLSIIGVSVVEAARIISNSKFYPSPDMILLTEKAAKIGGYGLSDIEPIDRNYVCKGLSYPLVVCKLR